MTNVVDTQREALEPVVAGRAFNEAINVRARGYWEGVWLRFLKDRFAVAGGITIILLFIVAFPGAPSASGFLGHGPNEPFISPVFDPQTGQQLPGGVDADGIPVGP